MIDPRLCALAALGLLAFAAPALADPIDGGPISTANPTVFPTQITQRDPLMIGQDDPFGYGTQSFVRDGKIHGMVQVGVGTSGYREGAVAINGPIGDDGYFGLAVSDVQYGGQTRRAERQPAQTAAPAPAQ